MRIWGNCARSQEAPRLTKVNAMSIDPLSPLSVASPALWLIPYTQLKTTAREAWARQHPTRVMPRIMTLREWASTLGAVTKAPTDLHFNVGIDRLTAQTLMPPTLLSKLDPTGRAAAVQRLLDMACEVAPTLAAMHPSSRLAWAHAQVPLLGQGGSFQWEGAIGLIALMWAATSSFDTDVLWHRQGEWLGAAEHLYTTPGVQPDPLLEALLAGYADKRSQITLASAPAPCVIDAYACADAEAMVWQTAALVLQSRSQHMALVVLDRQLTRRISRVLLNRGVRVVDETGWALSTTTAAAQLMAWLGAMAQGVSSDAVLMALKTVPVRFAPTEVSALEARIRARGDVAWAQAGCPWLGQWPARFAHVQNVSAWLEATQALLTDVGLWDALLTDEAGQAMVRALWLPLPSDPKMSYAAFLQWVRAVLEASRFRLPWAPSEPSDVALAPSSPVVTVLPLAQTWARHFDEVLIPGCDERFLPARPRLNSDWSAAQREALQLPSADDAASAQARAWEWLTHQPSVKLLWACKEGNEALQPSSLVQRLDMQGRLARQPLVLYAVPSPSPSQRQGAAAKPLGCDVATQGVVIDWQQLAPRTLSASSYADLRACPYRFYALRLLGLQSADELDDTVDKRDFGTWLHGTLHRFHEALQREPGLDRTRTLNASAQAEQQHLGLSDAAFLPFALGWPKTREAYLAWLAEHEASGAQYREGEVRQELALDIAGQTIRLVGKVDRIDSDGHGGQWLLDYKTEGLDKTKRRIQDVDEDIQLAFYALLGGTQQSTQAAYVNVVERASADNRTQLLALPDVAAQQAALQSSIRADLSRIATGHALRALGEGDSCTYCQARGLCRRDFRKEAA